MRAGAVSPSSQDTWATGSYDHVCKLWDVRTGQCMMNLDHGAPIEDLQFFTSGGSSYRLIFEVQHNSKVTGLLACLGHSSTARLLHCWICCVQILLVHIRNNRPLH